ncbi:hypothetical protein GCM10010420_15760 [Streptomyces glaucosporus]|uniref:C2H2-type domain-containing protein n=1 Tax=Streptomyces glaucosporus TaxID=284044 RepID=A0ABP5V1S7_9ACTN
MSAVAASFPAPRLRRLARRPARPGGRDTDGPREERCDLCPEPLPADHRHLLDLHAGAVSCACRACSLLFDRREAGGAHYRLLPRRRVRLGGNAIDDALWASLGVPVGLAFLVRSGRSGEVTACCPGPLGLLRSPVDPDRRREAEEAVPALAALADDVEALLVDRSRDAREHWIVPLDDCHRLAAVVRTHWKGPGGGSGVRRRIEDFFRTPAGGAPADGPPPGGLPHRTVPHRFPTRNPKEAP